MPGCIIKKFRAAPDRAGTRNLRNGRLVGEYPTAELPRLELVGRMIGKDLSDVEAMGQPTADVENVPSGPPFIAVKHFGRAGSIQPLDLDIHAAEVVGLAGLIGSGRTETARLLFGADRAHSGEVRINGEPVTLRSPRDAIRYHIAFTPEDRKVEGIIPHLSVRENIALALGVSLLLGACNGALVAWIGIQPIVATLILMVAGRGIAQLITGGQIINFNQPALVYLGNGHLLGLPFTLSLVLVMLALTYGLTRGTALGLFIESVGDNDVASRYAGVNARRVKFMAYVFAGLCAGPASLVAASNIKSADANHAGLYLELDAIAAVVIGGTLLTGGVGFIPGTLMGVLILSLIQTLITFQGNLNSWWTKIAVGALLLLFIVLQKTISACADKAE